MAYYDGDIPTSDFKEQLSAVAEQTVKDNGSQTILLDDRVLREKAELKSLVKSKIKRKFYVGHQYMLRTTKSKDGCNEIVKTFICKKYIYTINNEEVMALIMKQISGKNNSIFTLNRNDCQRLHLKYEPGLQVFSMYLPWKDITVNSKKQAVIKA